jgi:hypothetical protein
VGVLVLVISTVLALALGTAALRRFDTPVWPVVGAAFVAAADFITYAAFGIGCSDVIENPPARWIDACRAYPEPLPLVGIVAVLGGGIAAWSTRRPWPLAAGLIVGIGVGLFPWIAYGDPGYNWNGLVV